VDRDLLAPTTVETVVGQWGVRTALGFPAIVDEYRQRAALADRFPCESGDDDATALFVAVARPDEDWPSLVVTQCWGPSGPGFAPGVLVVPETGRVFIGAGGRLLCYRELGATWTRQWEAEAAWPGFWGWHLHGNVVLMAGEVELRAWTTAGEPLWAEAVDPPWSYRVTDGIVEIELDGGRRRRLALRR
jgi:hypothetical protein